MEITTNHKIIVTVVAGLFAALFLRTFVVQGFIVRGDSMSPSILSGDFVLVNKLSYIWSEPERGDIVVAWTREDPKRVIKRVMGLPGEKFTIDNGRTTNVDPNEYYLMGDNTEVSADSDEFGFVDSWDIKGRVFGSIRFKNLKYIDL